MDFATILELIGSYAFPIVACIAIFKKSSDDAKAYREEIRALTESHRAETDKLAETIQNNTIAVNHLADMIKEDQYARRDTELSA